MVTDIEDNNSPDPVCVVSTEQQVSSVIAMLIHAGLHADANVVRNLAFERDLLKLRVKKLQERSSNPELL